jgi:hypothetical protein
MIRLINNLYKYKTKNIFCNKNFLLTNKTDIKNINNIKIKLDEVDIWVFNDFNIMNNKNRNRIVS